MLLAMKVDHLPIVTQRLVLRNFVRDDISSLVAMVSNSRFSGYRQFRPDHVIEDVTKFVDDAIKWQAPDPGTGIREIWRLGICLKSDDTHVIGYVYLWEWSGRKEASPELGYFLDPAHQGHGYATEASQGLLRFFHKLHPDKPVFSMAHPENIPSRNVLVRLGFKETGTTWLESAGVQEPRVTYKLAPPRKA